MKDWQPKVGDIVVRDPDWWEWDDDMKERKIVTGIDTRYNTSFFLDHEISARQWIYWMLDKNAIVTNILNDL